MPLYTYTCELGHTFDQRGSLDADTTKCPMVVDIMVGRGRSYPAECNMDARRHSVYESQGIAFKGEGFTRSVAPPPAPLPRTTKGESTRTAFEIQDEFAKTSYEDDIQLRPYRKEEVAKKRDK